MLLNLKKFSVNKKFLLTDVHDVMDDCEDEPGDDTEAVDNNEVGDNNEVCGNTEVGDNNEVCDEKKGALGLIGSSTESLELNSNVSLIIK